MLPPFPDIHVCLPSQFKCTNTNRCIPGIFRCNGQDNCGDGEDEKDCRKWGTIKHVRDEECARLGVMSSVLHQIHVFGYWLLCKLASGWSCPWAWGFLLASALHRASVHHHPAAPTDTSVS